MTEPHSADSSRFAIVVVAVFVVAGTIALPDVWLQTGPSAPAPEGLFEGSDAQLDEWVCAGDECFFATDSIVTRLRGSGRVVEWVINTENPLTDVPLTDEGRAEDVEIAAVRTSGDTLYLELESGRLVSRTRDGTWRPGVAEFRNVMNTAIVLAVGAASAVIAVGWLRTRRVDAALLIVAGMAAAVVHLPITIWRHTTSFSLSTAALVSLVVTVGALWAAVVVAGPRVRDTTERYIPGT